MFETLKQARQHRKAQWEAIPQDQRDRIQTKEFRALGYGMVAWSLPFGILALVFGVIATPLIQLGNADLAAEGLTYALGYGLMASLGPAFGAYASHLVRRK